MQETPAPATPKHIGIVLPPSIKEAYENTFYLKAIRGISQVCNQRQVTISVVTGTSDMVAPEFGDVVQTAFDFSFTEGTQCSVPGSMGYWEKKNGEDCERYDTVIPTSCESIPLWVSNISSMKRW